MTALVLAIVFTLAVSMRSYASKYGFYLNEFDPYYDYYAASHIVNLVQQHGLFSAFFNNPAGCTAAVLDPLCHSQQGYFYWHDVATWFPYGRDVAASSQGGLQTAGAIIYLLVHNVFGVQITLYDLLVILPVILGAFTAVLFYFLVRKVAGDAAGLFAALLFAVSPPLIERGNLGWFKSEPLAILLFVGASYLVLTIFDKERSLRNRVARGLMAGLLTGYANTAWGGGDYFSAAFGLLFVLLPFMNLELSSFTPALVTFTSATILASAAFPRPGPNIVTNPVGLALIGGTVFVLLAQWSKTWVKPAEYRPTLYKLLFGFVLGGLFLVSFNLVGRVSGRYLTALAPWLRSGNPLVQSVAEHFVPTGQDYFVSYAILLSLGMAGAIVAFRRRSVPMMYALIFGLTGLYFSSAFSRLLVYSSIALGILGAIGFAELAFVLVKPATQTLVKKKPAYTGRNEMKVVFSLAMVALIAFPAGTYWIPNPIPCTSANTFFCDQSPADSAVSLSNGATIYSRSTMTDWIQTLQWARQDTPTNSIIISWWDYGYWFAVMGNRTTAADNATINQTRIAQIGQMLMANSTQAATIAKRIAYDASCNCTRPVYVAIFITGSFLPKSLTGLSDGYYVLQVPGGGGFTAGGGDESKKQWFIRIGALTESKYLEGDAFNFTPYALNNSLFVKLLPFKFSTYLVSQVSNGQTSLAESPTYTLGERNSPPIEAFVAGYTFPANSTGPFRLAYASPTGVTPTTCPGNSQLSCFTAIFVYQVV
ncbi:MAG: hypothetical protein HY296_08020 [Thaumarchaeota archaeon]|nr:hypothetical protein [Nitrososphaerota archaeon]